MMVIMPSSQKLMAMMKRPETTATPPATRLDVVVADDAQTVQPVEKRQCQQQQVVAAPERVVVTLRDIIIHRLRDIDD